MKFIVTALRLIMTAITALTENHRLRLEWFAERAGQTTNYPLPLDDGSFLVSRPKGIFKPADLNYALSVRINVNSPYADGEVRTRDDGSWFFDYHQENPDPAKRDKQYTNRGLMACLRDTVPVGVLRERRVATGARPEYDVLGLAIPVDWRDGYFIFESAGGPSSTHRDTVTDLLRAAAEEFIEAEAQAPPGNDYDARRRVHRHILARQGQSTFRRDLLTAYASTCAVTGATATMVLDAAHLRSYRGPESNVLTNGLLLRTDIHTLLDLQLIAFDPENRHLMVSTTLANTEYAALAGTPLREPRHASQRPARDVLAAVRDAFLQAESHAKFMVNRSRRGQV